MSETSREEDIPSDVDDPLRRAERLEKELIELRHSTDRRVILADLTVEAVKAGMVDLDGLKLLDLSQISLNSEGRVGDARDMMIRLKQTKPWLFGTSSSSNPTGVPPSHPPRQKLATEMSDDEYRAARMSILKHQR